MMRKPASGFLSGIFLLVAALPAAAEIMCVAAEAANVREGPGVGEPVAWEAERHTPFKVLAWDGEWAKVMDVDGDQGWAHQSVLSSGPCVVVAGKLANVRSGPGLEHVALWEVEQGFAFRLLRGEGDWVEVTDGGEISGWIFDRLVWGSEPPRDPGGV